MPQVLDIEGLTKSFSRGLGSKRRVVLQGLGFRLAAGASLGLVGPNGSGKSTLLRSIVGIETPEAGSIQLFGSSPKDPLSRARLGYLPETTPFPRELSAWEALDLVAGLHGWTRRARQQRLTELLEEVGLSEHGRRPLGSFSKGMQRRFGLAQAFLHRPDLLLLDEPTAGLDAPGHLVLAKFLAEARQRKASMIIASHQLDDIIEHCDTLMVLVAGRMIACGSPMQLFEASGKLRLELEGLSSAGLDRLEHEIQAQGARLVSRGPSSDGLLELYRRLGNGAED